MLIQRINITLPEELLQELSFVIPLGKRSKFIAEAVSEKLKNRKNSQKKLRESLRANKSFYKQVAREWKVTELSNWPQ